MIIDCISDLHGYYPKLEGGDLLLLAGDYTMSGKLVQWADFFGWLREQPYEKKVLVAGNHDNFCSSGFPKNQIEADELKEVIDFLDIDVDFEYLCDSGTEYKGAKIWGSPWSLWFNGINQKCMAFTGSEEDLKQKYEEIPTDIDILITHSPPYGILDINQRNQHCGSTELRNIVISRRRLSNLKLHVFGHIHECGARNYSTTLCNFVNCSFVDESYNPIHGAQRIIL